MSYPPPAQPPAPPPGRYGPPPKQGHALELVLGALLGGIDVVLATFVAFGLVGSTSSGVGFLVGPVVGLLIPVVLLFNASTRWWGVGILIGFFLTLIVLGGACVALLSSLGG